MGVNVAAHTRHIFLGGPPPPPPGISDHMPGHMTVHVGRQQCLQTGLATLSIYYYTPRSAYSESPLI